MFTFDATIDAVQTGKKTLVNTFVQNEAVKETLVKFVDAQSDYTKKAAKVGLDTVTALSSEAVKLTQEALKFDYSKFNDSVTSAYKEMNKSVAKTSDTLAKLLPFDTTGDIAVLYQEAIARGD